MIDIMMLTKLLGMNVSSKKSYSEQDSMPDHCKGFNSFQESVAHRRLHLVQIPELLQ